MKFLTITLVAAFVAATMVSSAAAGEIKTCHNITGTCLSQGYVCANEQVVKHSQRCDGVEDCTDGTDEFMCEHADDRPLHERPEHERHEFEQATCVNCNCEVNTQLITSSSPWYHFGLTSRTDPKGLMTGAPNARGGLPCHRSCTQTYTLAFYKKTGICRGWLCCVRQRQCNSCFSGGSCPLSNNPNWWTRCYSA